MSGVNPKHSSIKLLQEWIGTIPVKQLHQIQSELEQSQALQHQTQSELEQRSHNSTKFKSELEQSQAPSIKLRGIGTIPVTTHQIQRQWTTGANLKASNLQSELEQSSRQLHQTPLKWIRAISSTPPPDSKVNWNNPSHNSTRLKVNQFEIKSCHPASNLRAELKQSQLQLHQTQSEFEN
jgi:hypothetical protein